MLNMALNECLEAVRGLRPEEEIADLIHVTDEIKTINPFSEWEEIGRCGRGGQAIVYKVKRKRDGLIAAMKTFKDVTNSEVKKVMQEASLISYINSDEMIKC